MDSAKALLRLRDIHLPKPIGVWPLAFGWYLLAALLVLLLIFGTYALIRYYRKGRVKREAQRALAQLACTSPTTEQVAAQVSQILRRVALSYYPREHVASLSGADWIAFLNQSSQDINFTEIADLLTDIPFQPAVSDLNLTPLFAKASLWIKQRKTPCLT